jgi:hypothetical protein
VCSSDLFRKGTLMKKFLVEMKNPTPLSYSYTIDI